MGMNRATIGIICAVAASLGAAGAASAGSNNVLRVIQTSPAGSVAGNNLFVDQSGAYDSLVSGPSEVMRSNALTQALEPGYLTSASEDASRAALQTGEKNTASITMTGAGGELQILQDNSAIPSAIGNTATVNALGNDTLGAVLQLGDGNQASLTLAESSAGLIVQNGLGNQGSLKVEPNGSGKLVQNGNGNYYPVTVDPSTTVTVTQNGNGLQPVGNVSLQVISTNPGTISITQTGY